jgi:ribonucleoside-diphosphate reductase alpha chain
METLNINNDELNVINRHGNIVPLDFNKILKRLNDLINMEPKLSIKADKVAQRTISMMVDKITTYELDMLSSKICGSLITENYDYNLLASRIVISNLHKETDDCLLTTLININKIVDENGHLINLINPKLIKFTENYYNDIHSIINYEKDFTFDYFGINTLMKSYLLKDNNKELNNIIERPQHLWMRVSIGIHLCYTNDEAYFNNDYNFNDIKNTYELLSSGYYTHATPTLFNAGTKHASLSSCYLLEVPDDLNGIYKTLSDTAKISKWSGGIGISITKVRSKGTLIKQTNGKSDGIVPMLKVYNDSALYVSQGGGKRKGSTAVYIEPWHADIEGFLDLKKPIGDESARARDLFLALWVPDLFMKRLIQAIENPNKIIYWSLMCPKKCINLINYYGYEFEKNYIEYENNKQYNKQINILNLWNHIMEVQMESGVPYIMYKDIVNRKGNQNNLGVINCSNLCAEINIYTDEKNTGVCNLASICLSKFVYTDNDGFTQFNYHKLFDVAKQVTYNINKVIDNNACPVPEGSYSDTRNRPIGLGIQGLADVFMMFKIPFTSDNAKELNKHIFETIYFGALTASNELAQNHGPYETYEGSMVSKGILQHDLCNVVPSSGLWDWDSLRENIKQYGIYNSLLTALMPTASTASIMGNTECFEPITSNMYMRNVLSGNFQIVNKYLIKDLIELGLWNNTIKQKIIANDGSIQSIDEIPQNIKDIYLTIWEYKLKDMIDMDADRGAYVCQSMSSNRYVIDCTTQKLTKMHIYAWKQNLKTSSYYIRTKTVNAVKFTVDPKYIKNLKKENKQTNYDVNDTESCMVCSA